jgi:hypothetical protein
METASRSSPDAGIRALEDQLRECYGRVAYSHKTHEKQADLYFRAQNRLKNGLIMLSAITTTGMLATVFGEGKVVAALAALLGVILTGLTAYSKDYDLAALGQRHSDSATRLWAIREGYLTLLTDLASPGVHLGEIRSRRDALQAKLEGIYGEAPRTTPKAYALAQQALKLREDLTFSPEEIDRMLPSALRRGSPTS